MSRNSQGLYTLPPGNPVVPNTLIESEWANTTMTDIADALTGSLPRDGSAPMTGPLTLKVGNPTEPRHATSKAYVDQFLAYATGMPLASVVAFAAGTAPGGFLLCDGQAVSRTTYSALFAAIGTIYGSGDGSTTFNVPDLRDWFVRGKGSTRTLGSKQNASFAAHVHPVSDPGHAHAIGIVSGSQSSNHYHSVSIQSAGQSATHSHGVNDPGHTHGVPISQISDSGNGSPPRMYLAGNTETNTAYTGISLGNANADHSHLVSGITAENSVGHTHTVSGTSAAAATSLAIGSTGGSETVPQNIALDYYIKALNDTAGPVSMTGITTSDSDMIAVDSSNPVVPNLVIKSNVAFGTVKLDASGKVPLAQMAAGAQAMLGFFDCSSGNNPSQAYPSTDFNSGDTYVVSVGGSIECYDPVTLVSALRPVVVGDLLQYIENSLTNPTGWYVVVPASTVAASSVIFAPAAGISATNVQDAIVEVQGNIPTTASEIAYVAGGTIAATNVQAAIAELDSETQTALGTKQNSATAVQKDSSTGAAQLPVGTQIQRPAIPLPGMLRFNDDTDGFEGFNGVNWGAVGGGATGAPGNPFVYENDIHVTANYQLTANKNGMSAGPITIDNGFSVTVPPGSVWTVV